MQDTKLHGRSNEGIDPESVIAIDRYAFNQGENAKYDFSIIGGYRSNNRSKRPKRCMLSNGDRIIGSLCARDYKGVGNEYIEEGKVIVLER